MASASSTIGPPSSSCGTVSTDLLCSKRRHMSPTVRRVRAIMSEPIVIVSGIPGSGKTSLGRPLAKALGVAFIAKDVIKEALGDVLGLVDVETSMRLGQASVKA